MEQHKLIQALPDHWKPYFSFAFCSGLRQGEQIGLKPDDIDWENSILSVRRGITLDETGKRIEGKTKNKYSRRKVMLTETILDALTKQKVIHNALQGEYFFCTENGDKVDASNLRKNVWLPSLSEASLSIRDMRQTRHSFATNALSHGENPLWIAKVMGHRNADMIIKV
jgi:integrase